MRTTFTLTLQLKIPTEGKRKKKNEKHGAYSSKLCLMVILCIIQNGDLWDMHISGHVKVFA